MTLKKIEDNIMVHYFLMCVKTKSRSKKDVERSEEKRIIKFDDDKYNSGVAIEEGDRAMEVQSDTI